MHIHCWFVRVIVENVVQIHCPSLIGNIGQTILILKSKHQKEKLLQLKRNKRNI